MAHRTGTVRNNTPDIFAPWRPSQRANKPTEWQIVDSRDCVIAVVKASDVERAERRAALMAAAPALEAALHQLFAIVAVARAGAATHDDSVTTAMGHAAAALFAAKNATNRYDVHAAQE